MRPLQLTCLLGLLAFAAPEARAQQFGSLFLYNYIEANLVRTEMDTVGPSLHGYGLRASIESMKGSRVLLAWRDTSGEGNDRQDIEAGVGFYNGINRQIDAIIDLKYLRSVREIGADRQTRDGFGLEGGLRTFVHDVIELDFTAEYRYLFESELGGHGAILFHGTRNIALEARYTYFPEQQVLEAGIRFSV